MSLLSFAFCIAYYFKSAFAGELLTFIGIAKDDIRSMSCKAHKFSALQVSRLIIDAEDIEYGVVLLR